MLAMFIIIYRQYWVGKISPVAQGCLWCSGYGLWENPQRKPEKRRLLTALIIFSAQPAWQHRKADVQYACPPVQGESEIRIFRIASVV
jgi:hypothetical protein